MGCLLSNAKALLDLQATDQQLATRRAFHGKFDAQLETQGGLSELRDESDSARARALETQVEHRRLESEAAAARERLRLLEERLYGGAITNVRELTAVELEHSTARKAVAQVEETLAPAMAAVAKAQGKYEELTQRLAEREKVWTTAESLLRTRRDELAKEIAEFTGEREAAMASIPEADLSLYESLLSRKGGVAVVRVSRGVCQGCRVRLPLRELSLLHGPNGLVSCSSCGRILLAE